MPELATVLGCTSSAEAPIYMEDDRELPSDYEPLFTDAGIQQASGIMAGLGLSTEDAAGRPSWCFVRFSQPA